MSEAISLADFGDWPATIIKHKSHKTIRYAYDNIVTACARLASFSSGSQTATSSSVNERQERLAVDDLVDFGIYARRLVEITATHRRFIRVAVRSRFKSGPPELSVLRVINVIIHHRDVEIFRSFRKLERSLGVRRDFEELLTMKDHSFPPFVMVKSDKDKHFAFDLRELVETFQKHILEPIVELCAEQNFYLEEY